VIVFAISDKGGTGRSVTSANVAFRKARLGHDVAYLDFDFGSPTAGAVFGVPEAAVGVPAGGLHSFLRHEVAEPAELDIWEHCDKQSVRDEQGPGRLILFPGNAGGGEFKETDTAMVERCVALFNRMEEQFEVTLVDLSAGRSVAAELALKASLDAGLRGAVTRWLVFHRWTRQHILAAHSLVHDAAGLIEVAKAIVDTMPPGPRQSDDMMRLSKSIRFIRTAVVDPDANVGLRPEQVTWVQQRDRELTALAISRRLDATTLFGSIPLDPVLQWQEQLITDSDYLDDGPANEATVAAFETIAARLDSTRAWETR
jgi:hypothetical protein